MKRPLSIRARFMLVSLVSVPLALAFTALFLVTLFKANLEKRTETELARHISHLAAAISVRPDGSLAKPAAADTRFSEPYGGLYWQIEDRSSTIRFRSDSLWDAALVLPGDLPDDAAIHRYTLVGPEGAELMALERRVIVASPAGTHNLRIAVAADRKPINEASMAFTFETIPYVAGVALFLIGAALVQLVIGLRPLSTLARELDRIRERQSRGLESVLPAEFAPVENALNRLLDAQSEAVSRARQRAGDLAHGLKTPLTVLMNNALTLREKGETAMAEEIEHLAGQMRLHTERELVRSRIAASAELRQSNASLAAVMAPVVRTLQKTPWGGSLDWQVAVTAAPELPVDPHDLRELVGNLLENASKWARSSVSATWRGHVLVIEDDGPGIDPEHIRSMTIRGMRYDETAPGSGLGLGIVSEICDVYGLTLTIENRQEQGLRVSIDFPSAA